MEGTVVMLYNVELYEPLRLSGKVADNIILHGKDWRTQKGSVALSRPQEMSLH
jgi:hypothetical protein